MTAVRSKVSYSGNAIFIKAIKAAAKMVGITLEFRSLETRPSLFSESVTAEFDIIGEPSAVKKLEEFLVDFSS